MKIPPDEKIIDGILKEQPWAFKIVEGWLWIVVRTPTVRADLAKRAIDPQDVVEDSNFKIWKRLSDGKFRRESKLHTFVWGVAKYTFLNHIDYWDRIRGREQSFEDD